MKFLIHLSLIATLNVVSAQYLQLPKEIPHSRNMADVKILVAGWWLRLHGSHKSTGFWFGPWHWSRRCMWSLFLPDGTSDPYDPANKGPFNTIIVQVTDMCPVQGNEQWCGQTVSEPINSFERNSISIFVWTMEQHKLSSREDTMRFLELSPKWTVVCGWVQMDPSFGKERASTPQQGFGPMVLVVLTRVQPRFCTNWFYPVHLRPMWWYQLDWTHCLHLRFNLHR
ncbi:hypothetical protein BDP27DRAFT_1484744 [Rhodocollybia butyracea]|uniref:Uncharacterized protein n=1 Tax=Rhodocollybia butyracea TaxID=206335 RepID=A0A9P5U0X7_9AGAR|nr:hypothetical protein BDP27DRAFT_1484744 [Rhodocollybia butyracea]